MEKAGFLSGTKYMIALEVHINGEYKACAGREDMSVLSAIINAVGVLGTESKGTANEGEGEAPDLFLNLGGMTGKKRNENDEYLRWLPHHDLQIGDTVSVKVIETSKVDIPTKEEHINELFQEESEREMFESAKHYYFENKHKFEPESG